MRALLLAMMLPTVTMAETLTVLWEHPTTREDGSELPLSELKESIIDYTCQNTSDSVTVPAPLTTVDVEIEDVGRCDFTGRSVNIYDQAGEASEAVSYTILPGPPGKPIFINIVIR